MTASDLRLITRLAADLSLGLSAEDRFQRIVHAILQVMPADAVSLLRYEQGVLVPLAMHGLSPDAMGRRFPIAEHPRLEAICLHPGPLVFPKDCDLPDPFDGLVATAPDLSHAVHACAGCPLQIQEELVGVLTLDALAPDAFRSIQRPVLDALAALAGAALYTAGLMSDLEEVARHQGSMARHLSRGSAQRHGGYLLGVGSAIRRLREQIRVLGPSELPVLVSGETGSGKEVAVHMIHAASQRADQPMIYVNCAALPESVAESELFGHEEGAFTDARRRRLGKFQVADGATLFLDEIGELPLSIQAKLLRTLQSGEVQSVGSDQVRRVDVRLLAATNRDLAAEVRRGNFRADLLHRLDVCRLHMPPLRDHLEDVPVLVGSICDDLRQRLGCGPIRVDAGAMEALAGYSWPGNVRELANVLSRSVLRAMPDEPSGGSIQIHRKHLGVDFRSSVSPSQSHGEVLANGPLRPAVDALKRRMVRGALARNHGSWAAAGRELGLHRSNLMRLAARLGVDPEE